MNRRTQAHHQESDVNKINGLGRLGSVRSMDVREGARAPLSYLRMRLGHLEFGAYAMEGDTGAAPMGALPRPKVVWRLRMRLAHPAFGVPGMGARGVR